MKVLSEAFNKLFEELLEESAKTDFLNKFGEKALNDFDKARDRLRNNGMSVDYGQYLKLSPKELQDVLLSLYDDTKDSQKKRIIKGEDKNIRGKYNYLGEKNGYKVYQPLDVQASIDLGVNTGWCTAGRYKHYGHPEFEPSYDDAETHFIDYTEDKGIKLYYFLDPKTMYGEYAIALYPETLDNADGEYGKYYINETNIEVFNAKDDLDYSSIGKLPLDLIPERIILDYKELEEIEIDGNVLVRYRGNDKTFVIPNSITIIGDRAFLNCHSLTNITIPNSVTSIGSYAFENCIGLTSITIPNSVTSIGNDTFYGCSKLTSIRIPDSVTSIGDWAFYACRSLTSIEIPNNVTTIGFRAFSYCTDLTSITIPDSVTSIDTFAFYGCSKLTSVTMPNNVTSIGFGAFSKCTGLTSVTIPNSVSSIGSGAFYGCSGLTIKTNNPIAIGYCSRNQIKTEPLN